MQDIFQESFDHSFKCQEKNSFWQVILPKDGKAIIVLDNCKAHSEVEMLVKEKILTSLI